MNLQTLTLADMSVAEAYVTARFPGATLTYSCPVWTICAISGRKHEGFTLAEAVAWHELREPADTPHCYCGAAFTFDNPWVIESGSYFHAECLQDAYEWPYASDRMTDREYSEAVGRKHPDQK